MQEERALHFLEEIIEEDLAAGKNGGLVHTRFPPEPNGYLHIGHASSIYLNFSLARKYGGQCNLRFDDTNPATEETQYVESIEGDVRWLGFAPDHKAYASDYFGDLYGYALQLIDGGLAYVDDSTSEEIAAGKGDTHTPGTNSPYRDRLPAENRALFEDMKRGKFKDGAKVLRAKIDMAHPNLLLRDPVIYRIKHAHHHRTGDAWCIYPMYDFAHGQSDAIEHITHSICTLEFIHHRPLYNWFIAQLGLFPSRQYEFARRNMTYTVMSKRKLLQLVQEGHVSGWKDPRMPTISGMRRRGYTPQAITQFCETIGVGRRENIVDIGLLEFCVREHLNATAPRRMAVLEPLKLTITNWPAGKREMLAVENNPEQPGTGSREVPFSGELWIEKEDFMEVPPRKFFRLGVGLMVRLKGAYIVRCDDFVKDAAGEVVEVKCTYIPQSRSGEDTSGLAPKGTIHWVSVENALKAEVRLYDRLFRVENPTDESGDFKDYLNPESVKVVQAWVEPALANEKVAYADGIARYQFLRKGYFAVDEESRPEHLVFNRTVELRDNWAKRGK